MNKQKKNPALAIFKGMPCAFLNTFQEAIAVAETLPEGCRIVWLWVGYRTAKGHNYRVCRQLNLCQDQREDTPGSFTMLVWENGVIEVPEAEHAKYQREALPQRTAEPEAPPAQPQKRQRKIRPSERVTGIRFAHIGNDVFQRYLEGLTAKGCDVSELLKYRESLGEKPEPLPDTDGPAFQQIPALPPEPIRTKAAKVCEKLDSAIAVSVFDVIEQMKLAGLAADKILEVVLGLKPKGTPSQ